MIFAFLTANQKIPCFDPSRFFGYDRQGCVFPRGRRTAPVRPGEDGGAVTLYVLYWRRQTGREILCFPAVIRRTP